MAATNSATPAESSSDRFSQLLLRSSNALHGSHEPCQSPIERDGLNWISGYFDGSEDLYAAIWRKPHSAPAWQARHGLTPAQYQATFDQLASEGYRLELVSGYSVAGQDRFAAIWTK